MINIQSSKTMKTRNSSTLILSLIVAIVIGAWAVISPTPALASNNIEAQDFANKESSIQGWNNLSEYYANYYGGVVFENQFLATSATSPIKLFYANYYGDVALENTPMATSATSPIKLFYANYYSDVALENQPAVTSATSPIKLFYANYSGAVIFD